MTQAQQDKKRKNRERRRQGARYSYVVLAVMTLVLAAFSVIYTSHEVGINNQKFCKLMVASLSGAKGAHKPANPAEHQSEEKLYEDYLIVRDLSHSLGCS